MASSNVHGYSLSPALQAKDLSNTNPVNAERIASLFSTQDTPSYFSGTSVSGIDSTAENITPTISSTEKNDNGLGENASAGFSSDDVGFSLEGKGDGANGSASNGNASGVGGGEALDSIATGLKRAGSLTGLLSNFAPDLAPLSNMFGLAGTVTGGLSTVDDLVNEEQTTTSLLGNIANLLGVGATFSPALAPLAMGVGAVSAGLKSYQDGLLGDALNTRSNEDVRDRVEDIGWSVSDTADMAARDNFTAQTGLDPGTVTTNWGTEVSISPSLTEQDTLGQIAASMFDDGGDGGSSSDGTSLGGWDSGESDVGSRLGEAAAGAFGTFNSSGDWRDSWGGFSSGGGEGGSSSGSASSDSSSSGSGVGGFGGGDLGKGSEEW